MSLNDTASKDHMRLATVPRVFPTMLRPIAIAALLLVSTIGAAGAACLVDYKAKKEDPLQLHYGIIAIEDDAACEDPDEVVAERIAVDGWQLLTVMGKLTEEEAEQRQTDAGAYYLRY
jgi:hypothetical protein